MCAEGAFCFTHMPAPLWQMALRYLSDRWGWGAGGGEPGGWGWWGCEVGERAAGVNLAAVGRGLWAVRVCGGCG